MGSLSRALPGIANLARADLPLSMWEVRECVARVHRAMALPRGQRSEAVRRVAADYGVSDRTLYRWRKCRFIEGEIGGFTALFIVGNGEPSRVTPWEKAA